MSVHLELIPLDFPHPPMLERLAQTMLHEIGLQSRTGQALFDVEAAFDPIRRQYNASMLRRQLRTSQLSRPPKSMIITDYDLFIPVLTFVFGEAQLSGDSAIISTCRLHPNFYGQSPDNELLFLRLCKEVIHETGHLYGLRHCQRAGCVMAACTNIETVDARSSRFCLDCLRTFARERDRLRGENHSQD